MLTHDSYILLRMREAPALLRSRPRFDQILTPMGADGLEAVVAAWGVGAGGRIAFQQVSADLA